MLEDLHHFDSISWSFLTTVAEKMSDQVLVVTTMRPNDGVLSVASRHEEGKLKPRILEGLLCQVLYPDTASIAVPACCLCASPICTCLHNRQAFACEAFGMCRTQHMVSCSLHTLVGVAWPLLTHF